jgi:hypothetical protein
VRAHFTPLRLGVVGLLLLAVIGSSTDPRYPTLLIGAALILLLVGRVQGWRF